jgi:hypothetical protein
MSNFYLVIKTNSYKHLLRPIYGVVHYSLDIF